MVQMSDLPSPHVTCPGCNRLHAGLIFKKCITGLFEMSLARVLVFCERVLGKEMKRTEGTAKTSSLVFPHRASVVRPSVTKCLFAHSP